MADDLPTPSNEDDIPPVAIRRPDSDAPADTTPEDKEEQELKKQREYYSQQQAELVRKMHDLDEKYKTQGEPMVNDIYNSLAQIDSTPTGQLDSLTDSYRQEMAKNTQQHGTTTLAGLFALLGISAAIFGRHRGWGATAGIYQGIGNALTLYSRGQELQSRDQQSKALKMISLMHQENQERLAQKREILSDKRLTMQQKMDMLKTHHELYQDEIGMARAEQSTIDGQMKIIHQQEQALQGVRRLKLKFHTDVSKILKTKDAKAWAEYVRVTSKGEIDPQRSDQELGQAEQLYPLEDYIKERHDVGKLDEKGKEKGMTGVKPKDTNTPEDQIRKKAKEFWNTQ